VTKSFPVSNSRNKNPQEFAAKEKLEIVLSAPVPAYRSGKQGEAGGRGGCGGPQHQKLSLRCWVKIPPADLPAEVSTQAGPSQFRSDIFKQTPQFRISQVDRRCRAARNAPLG